MTFWWLVWVKEARMAEQYILNMEEGQIQREMPVLRPYDVMEYRGVQQSPAPTRSIVHIPKFSGQRKHNGMDGTLEQISCGESLERPY